MIFANARRQIFLWNNGLAVRKGSHLANQSPESRITKMSPLKKIDQDNPNPSSMFTPCHYDYYDNSSNMSFSVDNTIANLKGIIDPLPYLLLGFVIPYLTIYSPYPVQLIKYRSTKDLSEISASVPAYPRPMNQLRRST